MEQPTVLSLLPLQSTHLKTDWIDKHWALQELKYDWEAELSGTGSRSRVEF